MFVGTIFFECEKIFRSFTSQFQPVLKCSDLVQEMQTNSLIISNFNFLCYDIEPRINKEINLLEIMDILICWKTCLLFFLAEDIKDKHKIRSNKSKSRSLRSEIKKSSSSKDMGYSILHQNQLQSQEMTLNICRNGTLYSHTFLKTDFCGTMFEF